MMTDTDSISRNRIVSETDRNFFVEAGAGSGKTTMLVNRMIAMVESGKPIDKICAITFTRAAAGEFYDRFRKILIERSNPDHEYREKGQAGELPEPTVVTRSRCEEALKNIDMCFMGTIDSFCNMVLGEHPSEAGIPSDSSVIEDAELDSILKREYVNLSAGVYGRELAEETALFASANSYPEEAFVQGMQLMLNHRDVHFNYKKAKHVDIDKVYKDEQTAIVRLIQTCMDHPEIVYTGNKTSPVAYEELKRKFYIIKGRWSANLSDVIRTLDKMTKLEIVKEAAGLYSIDDSITAVSSRSIKMDLEAEDGILTKLRAYQFGISMAFFDMAADFIARIMRDSGKLTYYDYLFYLREVLKKDAMEHDGRLIRYIYNRHSYFLIDEFQDTNPMQAEVFFYLSARHPVADWRLCDPIPGSLFIVGDPKQSIYRFRGADVTSFIVVRKLFESGVGEVLKLTRNFRSGEPLCEYFNRVFQELLPEDTDTQSRFEPIPVPEKTSGEVLQGAYFYECYEGKEGRQMHPDLTDESQIIRIIQRLVGKPGYQIIPAGSEEPRSLMYKDFMIILSAKTNLSRYIRSMDAAGIPIRVEGKVPFDTCTALKTIYAVYAAVSDTHDRIALVRALKGILIRFSADLLGAYRQTGRRITLQYVSYENDPTVTELPEELVIVDDTIRQLRDLAEKAESLSPAALFSEIMDTFEIYKYVSEDNLEVVYYTLELIRSKERDGEIVTLRDGAAFIRNLVNGGSEEERVLSLSDDANCVHIANLHKVKGLEAPVVILAYAWPTVKDVSARIEYTSNPSQGYVFRFSKDLEDGKSANILKTEEHKDKHELEKACAEDERVRQKYVAATRARNVLIISKPLRVSEGAERLSRSFWSELQDGTSDFMSVIEDEPDNVRRIKEKVSADRLYELASDTCVLNDRNAEQSTYELKNPSREKIASKMEEDTDPTEQPMENNMEKGVHHLPALFGTMTHRLMEMIISSRNRINREDAVEEIIREYSIPFSAPYETEIRKALSDVCKTLDAGGYAQDNGAPEDIVGTLMSADEVCCETPFCYQDGNDIWDGVMDVIYKDGSGWHILDYKTNYEGANLDKKYAGQLQAYQKAFKEMTGEDADAKIYHINE